jgi:hypothetical protein
MERDPLLSRGAVETAAPKEKRNYPINYYVPNFGVDSDIASTQNNEKNAASHLGSWNPKKGTNGKYDVPKEVEFKL